MSDLKLVKGDLFTANTDAIAQGCNCRGVMGGGIAAIFGKRYPTMKKQYERLCRERLFSLGSVHRWDKVYDEDGFSTIFNLGTQLIPGRDARVEAIDVSLHHMADVMWQKHLRSVAIPLIGCRIGGLSWSQDVRPIVEEVAERVEITVFYLNTTDMN